MPKEDKSKENPIAFVPVAVFSGATWYVEQNDRSEVDSFLLIDAFHKGFQKLTNPPPPGAIKVRNADFDKLDESLESFGYKTLKQLLISKTDPEEKKHRKCDEIHSEILP
jgi:hypothetical protein